MTFETAQTVSLVLHYVVSLGISAAFILYKPTIIRVFFRTYILLFVWIGATFLFDGCLLTYLENWVAVLTFDRAFYPDYGFSNTDASKFLAHWDLLFPLALILLIWVLFPSFNTARWRRSRYLDFRASHNKGCTDCHGRK